MMSLLKVPSIPSGGRLSQGLATPLAVLWEMLQDNKTSNVKNMLAGKNISLGPAKLDDFTCPTSK